MDLSYEILDAPSSHFEAEKLLVYRRNNDSVYFVGDGICSVVMQSSGYYMHQRPPFSIWLSMAKVLHNSDAGCTNVSVLAVSVVIEGQEVFRQGSFKLKLRDKSLVHSRPLVCGSRKILLPDKLLNPQDGKEIAVMVYLQEDGTKDNRQLKYRFRPKIKKGRSYWLVP